MRVWKVLWRRLMMILCYLLFICKVCKGLWRWRGLQMGLLKAMRDYLEIVMIRLLGSEPGI